LAAISQSVSESLVLAQHADQVGHGGQEGDRGEGDLDAHHALLGPVDVLELEQQRRLVEHEGDADAERDGEVAVEVRSLGGDGDAAGGQAQQAAGDEMVDVALADDHVLDRAQATLLADRPRDRARDPEGDRERRQHVEERVLARAADLVALADDLDRLQGAVAAAAGVVLLAALGQHP
jgi:hypothetical protein